MDEDVLKVLHAAWATPAFSSYRADRWRLYPCAEQEQRQGAIRDNDVLTQREDSEGLICLCPSLQHKNAS